MEGEPDQAAITASVHAMIKEVQKYVPGYKLVNGPVFDGNRVQFSWKLKVWVITCLNMQVT